MENLQQKVINWVKTLKGWQCELAYRLLIKEKLENSDIDESGDSRTYIGTDLCFGCTGLYAGSLLSRNGAGHTHVGDLPGDVGHIGTCNTQNGEKLDGLHDPGNAHNAGNGEPAGDYRTSLGPPAVEDAQVQYRQKAQKQARQIGDLAPLVDIRQINDFKLFLAVAHTMLSSDQ